MHMMWSTGQSLHIAWDSAHKSELSEHCSKLDRPIFLLGEAKSALRTCVPSRGGVTQGRMEAALPPTCRDSRAQHTTGISCPKDRGDA